MAGSALALACASGDVQMRFATDRPRDAYEAHLRQAGLHATALGRDWIAAAGRALVAPVTVQVPYREARYLDPARASAVAYRMSLEQGQRLVARVDMAGAMRSDARLFLDLFFVADSAARPQPVASADPLQWRLAFVALRRGDYLLLVQPELLRGGRITFTVSAHASLRFPVAGRTMASIRSRFGASRDAGERDHDGVDIFAPRGTPVVAAAAGRVTRSTRDRLGGNVVWLHETGSNRRLYYAHLDQHAVLKNDQVKPGDTLGFVGNTGNAQTTPPHLHFGVYLRGRDPVDPHFHLYEPRDRPAPFAGDTALVGRWARVVSRIARVRARPDTGAAVVAQLERQTPIQVLAGTGRWYLARLPNAAEGYLNLTDTQPLEPIRQAAVTTAAVVRTEPTVFGFEMDSIARGQVVPILGRYGNYLLVRHPSGFTGWISRGNVSGAI
jgi:murein DD-endopeptidase MepM/ murein hydrolase activator NlpD